MKRTNQILILLIVIAIPFLQGCPQAESLGPVDGHYIERYIILDSIKNINHHVFSETENLQYLQLSEKKFLGTLYEGTIYDGDQKVGGNCHSMK